jgi:hypothetical protein
MHVPFAILQSSVYLQPLAVNVIATVQQMSQNAIHQVELSDSVDAIATANAVEMAKHVITRASYQKQSSSVQHQSLEMKTAKASMDLDIFVLLEGQNALILRVPRLCRHRDLFGPDDDSKSMYQVKWIVWEPLSLTPVPTPRPIRPR